MVSQLSDDFKEAIVRDEYAEFEFGPENGFILVTDWEGDGSFEPDVLVEKELGDRRELEIQADDALNELIDFTDIEFDKANSDGTYYVFYVHGAKKGSALED